MELKYMKQLDKEVFHARIVPYSILKKVSKLGQMVYADGLGLGIVVGYLKHNGNPAVYFYYRQKVFISFQHQLKPLPLRLRLHGRSRF